MMRCPLKENKDKGQYFSHSTNSFPMSSNKKQERGHLHITIQLKNTMYTNKYIARVHELLRIKKENPIFRRRNLKL